MSTERKIAEELQKCFELDVYAALLNAVEKQIPYKPTYYSGYPGKCKCGTAFLDKSTNFCGNCGQKLDWRD